MAIAIIIALRSALAQERRLGSGSSEPKQGTSVTAFSCSVLAVGLVLFWSWPALLRGGEQDLLVWGTINMTLPIIVAAAIWLWGQGIAEHGRSCPFPHAEVHHSYKHR